MAITLDFESNNPSSNLGRTLILLNFENFPDEIFIVINYFFISCQSSSSRSYNPDLYQDNECYLDVKISSRPRSSAERLRDRQRSNSSYQRKDKPKLTVEFTKDIEISDIEDLSDSEQEYDPNDYFSTTYRSDYQYYTDDSIIRYKPIKVKEFEMQKTILYKAVPKSIQNQITKPGNFTVAKPVKIKSGPACVQTISKFTKQALSSQNRYAHTKLNSKNHEPKVATKSNKKSTKISKKLKKNPEKDNSPTNCVGDSDDSLPSNANLPKSLFLCQFCSSPFHSIISLRRHEMIFCTKDWTKLC